MVVALGPGKFYGSSLPRPRIYTDVKFNDERVDPPVPVLDPLMSWAQEAHWTMGGLSFKRHRLQGRIEGSITKLRAEREKILKKRKQGENNTNHDQTGEKKSIKISAFSGSDKNSSPTPPLAPIAVKRRRVICLVDEEEDDDDHLTEGGGKEKGNDVSEHVRVGVRRRPARKLGDDFDRVARESGLGGKSRSPVNGSSGGLEVVIRSQKKKEGGYAATAAAAKTVKVVDNVNTLIFKGKKLKDSRRKRKASVENGGSMLACVTRTSPRLAKKCDST